jgi:hypothetical protein
MARTDTVTVPAEDWIQLTNGDTTAVTFQVKSGAIYLVATVGAVEPTNLDNAVYYSERQGEIALALADLAPGTAGANRLYAWGASASDVLISHG